MLHINTIGALFAHSNTPHLVVSANAGFRVLYVNKAFCDWSGLSEKEILEVGAFPSERIADLLRLPSSSLTQIMAQVASTKSSLKRKVEPTGKATDGQPLEEGCVLEVYPIHEKDSLSALVVQIQPLTSIQPLPVKVTGSEATSHVDYRLLPLILDSLANVIFVLEVEGEDRYRFSFANKAFQVTTGLPVSKVEGSLVDEIIPEPSLSLVKSKYAEAIRTGKQVSWEEVSEYPAGKKTGQVVAVPVFDGQGKCVRLIGMVHDVTEFKMALEQQESLSQELADQNQDLQQFNYIVSHNLRAPVANALGLSKMLVDKPKESKEYETALRHLQESVKHMDEILIDLTHILSVRDRKDVTLKREVSLLEVFEQAKSDLRIPLEQSGAEVTADFAPDIKVKGYRAYLHSVFYNLLSNAIKYRSEERPLKISVKSEQTTQDCVKVTVSDNGSGFDAGKASGQVFRLYKRFHPNSAGKGVGLFLVKTQVEAMGGKIKVESHENKGTTFKILLVSDN